MSRKIGFTQNSDSLEVADEKESNKKSLKNQVGKLMMVGAAVIGLASCNNIFNSEDKKDSPKVETSQKEEAKKEETKKATQQPEPYKPAPIIVGKEAIEKYGDELIGIFNNEINNTKENAVFKSEFAIKDENTLMMSVDIGSTAKAFGLTEEAAKQGIIEGASAYSVYLQRFNNRIHNGKGQNLSLQVTDKHGNLITEVK